MTNTKTQNFFSSFERDISTLLGVGRYLMYMYERGTLRELDSCNSISEFIVNFLREHQHFSRAYYVGTPLFQRMINKARVTYGDKDLFDPVPIERTGNTQLYSLSGSGRELCWMELILYYKVGKFFKSQYVAQG